MGMWAWLSPVYGRAEGAAVEEDEDSVVAGDWGRDVTGQQHPAPLQHLHLRYRTCGRGGRRVNQARGSGRVSGSLTERLGGGPKSKGG